MTKEELLKLLAMQGEQTPMPSPEEQLVMPSEPSRGPASIPNGDPIQDGNALEASLGAPQEMNPAAANEAAMQEQQPPKFKRLLDLLKGR